MTKQEMRELWAYLRTFFPNARQLQDKDTGNAWYAVLKPYTAADVKEAFTKYLRIGKNFFPDISELTAFLPLLPGQGPDATHPIPDARADQRARAETEKMRAQWYALRAKRREAGVPETITEAQAFGMTLREWDEKLERLGLAVPPEWIREAEDVS